MTIIVLDPTEITIIAVAISQYSTSLRLLLLKSMCPNIPVKDLKFLNICVFLLHDVLLKRIFYRANWHLPISFSKVKHACISLKWGHIFRPLGLFLLRPHPQRLSLSKKCEWIDFNPSFLVKGQGHSRPLWKSPVRIIFLTPLSSLSLAKEVVCSDLQSSVGVKCQGHIIPLWKIPVHTH